MKPLNWLSVKWVLFFAAMFESNQTWLMKKSCCNTSYAQTSWVAILLLDPATIKTYDYACDFHHWHFCDTSNLEPYTSVWVSTVIGVWEYHLTDKKQECLHQQDDYACSLLSSPVIVVITFWWRQYHCTTRDQDFPWMSCHQVDVTASQSKE